jgi:peptidoglycan hydrolase-like protein with peptidoglycan-binding domain
MGQGILWLQGSLNKLGANPPLAEDGKNGPKTMAAVSQFQRQNGLPDTGLADPAMIAAIGQKLSSTPANGQAPGDLIVAIKQLLDQLQKGGGIQIPAPANDLTSTLQQVANILQKINIAPKSTLPASTQPQDQAAQLQKILDFVSASSVRAANRRRWAKSMARSEKQSAISSMAKRPRLVSSAPC